METNELEPSFEEKLNEVTNIAKEEQKIDDDIILFKETIKNLI